MNKRSIAAMLALTIILAIGTINASAATVNVTIRIEGMIGQPCATAIQGKLKSLEGVEEAIVNFEEKTARVKYDDQKVSEARLREGINSIGYTAVDENQGQNN